MTTKVQTSGRTRKPDIPADLVTNIAEHIADRHSTLTADERLIISLWIIHTYFYRDCEVTPYLHIAALTPDAGKTEIAHILSDLSYDGQIVYPTVARMSTFLDSGKHTMILDQIENLVSSRSVDQDSFNALVNHGNRAGVAWQVSGSPDRDSFFPKAFLGVGPSILREALASRSIRITVRPGNESDQDNRETRQAIRPVKETAKALKACIVQATSAPSIHIALANALTNKQSRTLIDGKTLYNRSSQIWRPLIAIADLISSELGKQIRVIVTSKENTEPEPVQSPADLIDALFFKAMREKRIPISSWFRATESPLPHDSNVAMSNADFGWPRPSGYIRGILPEGVLLFNASSYTAELRFRARDFKTICDGIGSRPIDVKRAYDDAGRLHSQKGRSSHTLPFHKGQGDISVYAIDVSIWLWPDKISIPNTSAYSINEGWNK